MADTLNVYDNTESRTPIVIAIEGNGARPSHQGGGFREGEMFTLNTVDKHAVCYDTRGNGNGYLAPTITGDHENRVTDYTAVLIIDHSRRHQYQPLGKVPTLEAHMGTGGGNVPLVLKDDPSREKRYCLRRLTPTECARLQGFPDWWCDGAGGTDSATYKMWGNGIALPCAADVLGRIAKEIKKETEEHESI